MATPFAGVQAPSVYRHKVGAFEITVLRDGNLALEAAVFHGDQARARKSYLRPLSCPGWRSRPRSTNGSSTPAKSSILVDTGASKVFPPDVGPPTPEPRRRRC